MQKASPWDLSAGTVEDGEPRWSIHTQTEQVEKLDSIIYLCAESIRICGILLQPVMPDRMKYVLDLLGVDEGRRTFADAVVGADEWYGEPMVAVGRGREGVVFPPLSSDS